MIRRSLYVFTILALLFSTPLPSRGQFEHSYLPNPVSSIPAIGLQLTHSDVTGVGLVMNLPTYTLEDGPQEAGDTQGIFLENASKTYEIGKPELPVYSALIGVPADAQIEFQVITDVSEALTGRYILTPVPRTDFIEEDATSAKLVYDRDSTAYSSDTLYPANS